MSNQTRSGDARKTRSLLSGLVIAPVFIASGFIAAGFMAPVLGAGLQGAIAEQGVAIGDAKAGAEVSGDAPLVLAQLAAPTTTAEYQRQLQAYQQAHGAFEEDASAYWSAVSDKRRIRNVKRRDHVEISADDYVLEQPPVYSGPKRPINPFPEPEVEKPRRPARALPLVADFLRAATQHFQFTPQRPANEIDFKRAYARAAATEGLNREQAVRVYSFETGGNGGYDMQSGFTPGRPGGHAISTAVGYNQLLTTNTVELLAEQGDRMLRVLNERAQTLAGPARVTMEHKIAVLKRMIAFCRSVPDDWNQHEKLANTEQGWGVHAMVLDIDVGPLLQTHKLLTSVIFARNKGTTRPLGAAELEMMNLTGDGTGLDMVTMPPALREHVPTSNFFQRNGYERNPVAVRNNTVAKLFAVMNARMDSNQTLPGARELAGVF